ncbi:MAG: gliding motility lipoprotein GldH [Prevotellaceae bacterium]|nr:gliding motility lipoprotein GldH [Prevotellaceae bacterium]
MKKFFIIIFSAMLLVSCGKEVIYSEFYQISAGGWNKDSVCLFSFDVQDTVSSYELDLLVRNTDNFPRQNLWLKVEKSTDGEVFIDSVNVFLADGYGRWRGKGIGSYYDCEYIYKQNVKFYKSGRYTYKITHLMRTENLVGIKNFGLQICKEK